LDTILASIGAVVSEEKMKNVKKLRQTPSDGKHSHGHLPGDQTKGLSVSSY